MDVLAIAFLGFEAQELSTIVGGIAGVVSAVIVLAVIGLALAPIWSTDWARQFGVDDPAAGPDPTELVPGRGEATAADGAAGEPDAPAAEPRQSEQSASDDVPAVAPDAAE